MGSTVGISLEHMKGILVFRLGSKYFCIDLEMLCAILNPKDTIVPAESLLPNQKIVFHGGVPYPLVDFGGMFGLEVLPKGELTQILVMEKGNRRVAFYVDCIEEIISFNRFVRESIKIKAAHDESPLLCELECEGRTFLMPEFGKIDSLVEIPYL